MSDEPPILPPPNIVVEKPALTKDDSHDTSSLNSQIPTGRNLKETISSQKRTKSGSQSDITSTSNVERELKYGQHLELPISEPRGRSFWRRIMPPKQTSPAIPERTSSQVNVKKNIIRSSSLREPSLKNDPIPYTLKSESMNDLTKCLFILDSTETLDLSLTPIQLDAKILSKPRKTMPSLRSKMGAVIRLNSRRQVSLLSHRSDNQVFKLDPYQGENENNFGQDTQEALDKIAQKFHQKSMRPISRSFGQTLKDQSNGKNAVRVIHRKIDRLQRYPDDIPAGS